MKNGSAHWKPHLKTKAKNLAAQRPDLPENDLQHLLHQEISKQLTQFTKGMHKAMAGPITPEPYAACLASRPVLWQQGCLRLRDCGGEGMPLLLIPSLINRAYILDLPGNSFVEYLAAHGFRPFIVDWQSPAPAEQGDTLERYILQKCAPALTFIQEHTGQEKIMLGGYCMGGLLALALAHSVPEKVKALLLIATPWDFHSPRFARFQYTEAQVQALLPWLQNMQQVPPQLLQLLFQCLHPTLLQKKYLRYGEEGELAASFRAVDAWANDGIAMTTPVARTCFIDWVQHNTPSKGKWHIGGEAVLPASLEIPTCVVVGEKDRVVPPCSALPLAGLLPQATTLRVPTGHVGMMAGEAAREHMWQKVAEWGALRVES